MFETVKVHNPTELFTHKLGAALTMEKTIVGMLETLIEEAKSTELKKNLRTHLEETQAHVRNLEQAFQAIGQEAEEQPCAAIEGIEKEGQANLKLTDESLTDDVILAGCAETEHHEIAAYESLIVLASAMGQEDVVALLAENLEQEQATLAIVLKAAVATSRQKVTA
jgi:ferritin-like metal-binding protein YciE